MNEQESLERRLNLSLKFIEMGKSLIDEGTQKDDYTIYQIGGFLLLIGSVVLHEEHIYEFTDFCSMFSAKKIIEGLDKTGDMTSKLSYDEFVKRLNGLNGSNESNDKG